MIKPSKSLLRGLSPLLLGELAKTTMEKVQLGLATLQIVKWTLASTLLSGGFAVFFALSPEVGPSLAALASGGFFLTLGSGALFLIRLRQRRLKKRSLTHMLTAMVSK